MNVDIYAYMHASPPISLEAAERGEPTLKELLVNKADPTSSGARAKPKSELEVSGSFELTWTDWRISSISESIKHLNQGKAKWLKERDKPSPLVKIGIVRRSWLAPGEVVVSSRSVNIKKKSSTEGTWSVKLMAPEQPGTYRVRVIFGQMHLGDRAPISSCRKVAVFDIIIEE